MPPCALAVMNAHASGRAIDREIFSDALMESVDVLHADDRGLLGWALPRLAAGVEALNVLSADTDTSVPHEVPRKVPHEGSNSRAEPSCTPIRNLR